MSRVRPDQIDAGIKHLWNQVDVKMAERLSRILDRLSDYFAHRKGLLPLLGTGFVVLNLALQFFAGGWIVQTNLFLHVGIVLAILGILVAWAL